MIFVARNKKRGFPLVFYFVTSETVARLSCSDSVSVVKVNIFQFIRSFDFLYWALVVGAKIWKYEGLGMFDAKTTFYHDTIELK